MKSNNNKIHKLINNQRIIKSRRSLHLPQKLTLLQRSLILIQDFVLTLMINSKKKIKRITSLLDKIDMLLTKTNTRIPKRLMMRFTVILKEWISDPPKTINYCLTPNLKMNIKVQTFRSAGVI